MKKAILLLALIVTASSYASVQDDYNSREDKFFSQSSVEKNLDRVFAAARVSRDNIVKLRRDYDQFIIEFNNGDLCKAKISLVDLKYGDETRIYGEMKCYNPKGQMTVNALAFR